MTRTARRQLERLGNARAARPDHHLRGELLEAFGIPRPTGIAARDVAFLELAPGAELTWPQQGDEVVELAEVVLERSRSEQQDVVTLDFLEELVARGRLVLDLVGLVDDDQVPSVSQDLAAVLFRDRPVVRDDRAARTIPLVGVGDGVELFEEFAFELTAPLLDK